MRAEEYHTVAAQLVVHGVGYLHTITNNDEDDDDDDAIDCMCS